jgi:hypothetical protein
MNIKAKSFLLLGLATIAVAGPQSAVSTKDWKSFATKDGKFVIKTPKSWQNSDPNDPASKEAMETIKKNNPNMAKLFENQDNQFELYVLDLGGDPQRGLNNMNLKVLKDSGLTTAMYSDVAVGILKQTGMKNSGWKLIELPAGKSVTYWGELAISMGEQQTMNLKVYGYLITKKNMTYICTMTTTPDKDKVQKPIFDAMAKSIALK